MIHRKFIFSTTLFCCLGSIQLSGSHHTAFGCRGSAPVLNKMPWKCHSTANVSIVHSFGLLSNILCHWEAIGFNHAPAVGLSIIPTLGLLQMEQLG